MEIAFETKSLRQICESYTKAKLSYGVVAVENLKHRLADLRAATNIEDIIVGNPTMVNHTSGEQYKITIYENLNMYLSANHNVNPRTNNHIDWSKVTRIKVIFIGRDNEK